MFQFVVTTVATLAFFGTANALCGTSGSNNAVTDSDFPFCPHGSETGSPRFAQQHSQVPGKYVCYNNEGHLPVGSCPEGWSRENTLYGNYACFLEWPEDQGSYGCSGTSGNLCPAGQQPVNGVCACADRAACNFEAAGTCVYPDPGGYPNDAVSKAACTLTGNGGRKFLITKKVLGSVDTIISYEDLSDTWGPALDACAGNSDENNRFAFVQHASKQNGDQWMYCLKSGATDNADTSQHIVGNSIYTSYEVTEQEVCLDRTACNFGSDGVCVFPGDAGSEAACTLTGATGRTFLITQKVDGHIPSNQIGMAALYDATFAEALDGCAAAAVHGDGSFSFWKVDEGANYLYCHTSGSAQTGYVTDGSPSVSYEVKEVCRDRTACNFESDGACVFPGTANSDAACTITTASGGTFRITAIIDGTKGYIAQAGAGEDPRWTLADAIDHNNWDDRCKTNRPESADLTLIRSTSTTELVDGQWGCGAEDTTAAGTNSAWDAGVFITYDVKQVFRDCTCTNGVPYSRHVGPEKVTGDCNVWMRDQNFSPNTDVNTVSNEQCFTCYPGHDLTYVSATKNMVCVTKNAVSEESCSSGYELVDVAIVSSDGTLGGTMKKCSKKNAQCQCRNGSPLADNIICGLYGEFQCEKCDSGTWKSSTTESPRLSVSVCLAPDEVFCECAEENGGPAFADHSQSCTSDDKNKCSHNCNCPHGHPVSNSQCNTVGETQCASCTKGYGLDGNECQLCAAGKHQSYSFGDACSACGSNLKSGIGQADCESCAHPEVTADHVNCVSIETLGTNVDCQATAGTCGDCDADALAARHAELMVQKACAAAGSE